LKFPWNSLFLRRFTAYIIMYIENQASRQSPPPIAPHYPSAYCGLGRTIRQPIAVWRKFYEERGGTHRVRGHVTQPQPIHMEYAPF